jgi:hypothetical protein
VYDAEFAEHVGEIITPYDHVDTEQQVEWGVQVFMFGYALGVLAQMRYCPETPTRELDQRRIDNAVSEVVRIAGSDAFGVSTERILEDFIVE